MGADTKQKHTGFTLIEILVIITLLGLIAVITYSVAMPKWRDRTYYARSVSELNTMANAAHLYLAKYNEYPEDVNRSIPSGLMEFIQANGENGAWPDAPWPGSVYDWDNWPPDANGPEQTYQISIRFCPPGDTETCKQNFPKQAWVTDDWDSNSSVYFCLKGSCRSHQNKPMDHPGYCINCGNKSDFY
jgi:prepilin-type N-terminal cleavage/methylation domain-containing protein